MSSLRPSPIKSTPLRDHMMRQMQLHRLSLGTQKSYAQSITDLAKYYWRAPHWRAPDQLTPDDIRAYLHYLLEERKLAFSTCNVAAAASRFFYVETLGWTPFRLNLPPRTDVQRLPRVLSVEALERLFASISNPNTGPY